MEVLVINQDEVVEALPMAECMDAMAEALKILGRGDGIVPLRLVMWLPEKAGAIGLMPGYLGADINSLGVKVVSFFPHNQGTEFDSHLGAVLLFETRRGQLQAIIDASEITAIRTAAVTGVATRLLAKENAGDLSILGSGTQARTHLEAMLVARNIKRVRVWSRNPDHANRFAERESKRFGVSIEPLGSVRETVDGADIICTTTAAKEPILMGDWIAEGAHINAVGSSVPFTRELDTAAVVESRLFVDRRESTLNEAGDFLIPKQEGAIDDDHIQGEIGEILLGENQGRQTGEEITLFKSLGIAIEDVGAACHIYNKALENGMGTRIELGGRRHD